YARRPERPIAPPIVTPVLDFIGVDTLLAELTVALGLGVLIGNALAFYKARRGEKPAGVDPSAEFRPSRALFLMAAGALVATWGIASIIAR
ncbi:MAG TPA: hypothetical protein VLB67_15195, partial [Acidimicrobiia bacterium]|nr:hypothetical protein [Acidimicrobiia bacterium]